MQPLNNSGKSQASKVKITLRFLCLCFTLFTFTLIVNTHVVSAQSNTGRLLLHFIPTANNKPIALNDSSYTNAFGEHYNISRLKFYLSNIYLQQAGRPFTAEDVFLIDAGMNDSIVLNVNTGNYSQLHFMFGIDSALNCSGAQSGALDPLNGMFWTWNTGYIFFKLEGSSPASKADQQRIEQHIGGYRSPYNSARQIVLNIPSGIKVEKGSEHHITIKVDIDKFFDGPNKLKLSERAMLMSPGMEAAKSADNISRMFSITDVNQ